MHQRASGVIKKVWNAIIWFVLLVLLVPSGLILASQNAVPGDDMYPVKRSLEDILLTVAPSPFYQGKVQIKYTQRRLKEVKVLASRGSVDENTSVSLISLKEQVGSTSDSIKKVSNDKRQQNLAKSYLETLEETKKSIQEEKTRVTDNSPTPLNSNQENQAQNQEEQPPNQDIPSQSPSSEDDSSEEPSGTEEEMEEVEEEVDEEIEEMKKIIEKSKKRNKGNSPDANQKEADQGRGKKESDDDDDNENEENRGRGQDNQDNNNREEEEDKDEDEDEDENPKGKSPKQD